ncbi:DNA polymerase subunit Cdc27 [Daedaleopsis nitida]|nr:DNA polymerase subunit Cdc27 [Daedaleopsis nitida]
MTEIDDYLTKQIYIDKNVVTYRSLSRQFGLHVNEAKNELAKFNNNSANSDTRSFATFLISGELLPTARVNSDTAIQTDDEMDVDTDVPACEDEDEEVIPTTSMTLVGENDLEHAKSRYARIFSTHVYCLSPSPLTDVDLICDPSNIVYTADAKDAPMSSVALGRVVGPDVYVGKLPVASSSKAPQPIARKPTLKLKREDSLPAKVEKKDEEKPAAVKPKNSGKLDWSKAKKPSDGDKSKVKETKVKKEVSEPLAPKEKQSPNGERDSSPPEDSRRGTKRKAAPPPMSDKEEESPQMERNLVPVKQEIKLRKNRVVSDDEDDEDAPRSKPQPKGKSRAARIQSAIESQEEASLRAMMDMDDSQVEKASASRPPARAEPDVSQDDDVVMASEPEPVGLGSEQDEDMVDDAAPKPKPRKKKEKKTVPVGRNGLKKKRVLKSRTAMDTKGYMLTEDYSSYESVDEEEVEEEAPKKAKGKKAAPAKPKKGLADETIPPKPKPAARTNSIKAKSAGVKPGAQGSLKDFFGKPKK